MPKREGFVAGKFLSRLLNSDKPKYIFFGFLEAHVVFFLFFRPVTSFVFIFNWRKEQTHKIPHAMIKSCELQKGGRSMKRVNSTWNLSHQMVHCPSKSQSNWPLSIQRICNHHVPWPLKAKKVILRKSDLKKDN